MTSGAREATVLSVIVFGVVLGLDLGSYGRGLGLSVASAVVIAAVVWLSVYGLAARTNRRTGSGDRR